MSGLKAIHSNKQRLVHCCLPAYLNRTLGVSVSEPFLHTGFSPPRLVVEIEKEAPALNTISSVSLAVDAEAWKPECKRMTREVIATIDALIVEFQAHRARLIADTQSL